MDVWPPSRPQPASRLRAALAIARPQEDVGTRALFYTKFNGINGQATKCDRCHRASRRNAVKPRQFERNARRLQWWVLRNKRSPDWSAGSRISEKGTNRRISGTSTITTVSKLLGILIFSQMAPAVLRDGRFSFRRTPRAMEISSRARPKGYTLAMTGVLVDPNRG
jgi:hypothetical protein